jgi:hypothetical protein
MLFTFVLQSRIAILTGKLDKCLRFLPTFIAGKLSKGIITLYVPQAKKKKNPKPSIVSEIRTRGIFPECDFSSCKLLAETKNYIFFEVLLPCLVPELQKTSSPWLKPKTTSRNYGRFFCNLLVETKNFGLGDVFLRFLSFQDKETNLRGIQTQHIFGVLIS